MILYLDTNEAFHASKLKKGDRMVVVRLLKEQPPEGHGFDYQENGHAYFVEYIFIGGFAGTKKSLPWHIKLRYPVGVEKLAVKEAWGIRRYQGRVGGDYWYEADWFDIKHLNNKTPCNDSWRSPVTMPKEAVRLWIKVVENRVDKCEGITGDELGYLAGGIYGGQTAYHWLRDSITTKYGKNAWVQYAEISTLEVTENA